MQSMKSVTNLLPVCSMNHDSFFYCVLQPNDYKRPDMFVEELVRHQVQYLGLVKVLDVASL
jgi:myosin heavy subunit